MKDRFYAETDYGCCIVKAADMESAREKIVQENGTRAYPTVLRYATKQDLAWVAGMGGYVP